MILSAIEKRDGCQTTREMSNISEQSFHGVSEPITSLVNYKIMNTLHTQKSKNFQVEKQRTPIR